MAHLDGPAVVVSVAYRVSPHPQQNCSLASSGVSHVGPEVPKSGLETFLAVPFCDGKGATDLEKHGQLHQGLWPPVCPCSPSSPQDPRLYLVFPHDSSALSSSFHHLQLFDQDSSNVVSVSAETDAGHRGCDGETPRGSSNVVSVGAEIDVGHCGCGGETRRGSANTCHLSPALPPGSLLYHLQ